MIIRQAVPADRAFWRTLDGHLPEAEFERKVRDGRAYVAEDAGEPVGLLRYNLFWDLLPFLTLLYIREDCRGRGIGRALMARWEDDMRALGHGMALTSTQVDEDAQHFYRRLGYRDCGGLTMDIPGYEQPMELFMAKDLRNGG